MTLKNAIPAVLAATILAGCAQSGPLRCPEPGAYADARVAQPYSIPEGFERPPERLRQRIPPGAGTVPAGLQGHRWVDEDGVARCLDQPPPMREDIRGR